MHHALDQPIRKAIAEIPGISTFVLFGSCARGGVHSRSDLDVAVLMNVVVVDEDILMRRLSAQDEYLRELREFQAVPREDFISQPRIHHLAERLLHLTCSK